MKPRRSLTTDAVQSSDVVITMGCGDTCPIFPGKLRGLGTRRPRRQGRRLQLRPIRDDIKQRVLTSTSSA